MIGYRKHISGVTALILAISLGGLIGVLATFVYYFNDQKREPDLQIAKEEIQRIKVAISDLDNMILTFSKDSLGPELWSAQNTGAAKALAQAKIGQLAAKAGLQLRSVAQFKQHEEKGFESVYFRIEGQTELDKLVAFFSLLQLSKPVLITDSVTIRRMPIRDTSLPHVPVFFQISVTAIIRQEN